MWEVVVHLFSKQAIIITMQTMLILSHYTKKNIFIEDKHSTTSHKLNSINSSYLFQLVYSESIMNVVLNLLKEL